MQTTIRDPRIAQGFSSLAKVFGGPSAQDAIAADLAARKRDYLMAQTAHQRAQTQAFNNQQANIGMIQSDMLQPDADYTDPAFLARLLSSFPGAGADYMKAAPGFVTGAGSLIDPNFRNADDFSRVLTGTGVVSNYGNTPAGVQAEHDASAQELAATLAGDLDVQRLRNAGNLALQDDEQAFKVAHPHLSQGGAGAPATVSPNTHEDLWVLVGKRLGLSDEMIADPATMSTIMPRLAEVYQQTKSAEAAIQQVMREFEVREESDRGILPWNWFATKQTVVPKAPADLPADNSAAGGAPAPAAEPRPAYPDGTIIRNPNTGERMIMRAGKWEPIE